MIAYRGNEVVEDFKPGAGGEETPRVFLAACDEKSAALSAAGIVLDGEEEGDGSRTTRYEFHLTYDYLSFHVPNLEDILESRGHIDAYFTAEKLVLLCDSKGLLARLQKGLAGQRNQELTADRALYSVVTTILAGNGAVLEDIEEEIERMEELTVSDDAGKEISRGFSADIVLLRKKLLVLKRYYEALFDLLEDLEENQNCFVSKQMLRNFRLHTNRVDRLLNTVINLRDYLTQVREAYQNQIDINLNLTMRLFTVITAIFLPLTLVVGWYGMNLQMPEYNLPHAYPVVIAVSAVVVAGCLWYFKKKRWF